MWFFAASRAARNKNTVPGPFFNTSIGSPTFEYTPDESRKAYRTEWMRSVGGRITWQASERNKIGVFADFQSFFNRGRGEFYSPEAFVHQYNLSPEQLYQTTWTSPVSSRLLLEAGFSNMRGRWPYPSPGDGEFASVPGAIHLRELTTGFRWNARQYYSDHIKKHRYSERASLSYVTGSHAFKAGFPVGARHLRVPAGDPRRRGLPAPERHSEPDLAVRDVRRRPPEGAPDPPGDLRPGSMDDAPPDAQPRPAVGRLQRPGAGPELSRHPVHPGTRVRGDPGRRPVHGHQPASGRRLRRVRHGPDRVQVRPRTIRRDGVERSRHEYQPLDHLGELGPSHLERRQFQLRAGLRPGQLRPERRMRADQRPQLRSEQAGCDHVRRIDHARLRQPQLHLGHVGGIGARAGRRRLADRRLLSQLGRQLARPGQHPGGPGGPSTPTASRRRCIRNCRAAGATRSAVSTT